MRTIKRFAVGLLMTLTAALLAVGATGCTAKGDRENREHVCSWEITSITKATCDKNAVANKTCSVCGEKATEEVKNSKLSHAYETVKGVKPTCTEPGYEEAKKCTLCGDVKSSGKEIKATGHDTDFSNPKSKAANCQQGAYCGDCNTYYGEKLNNHTTDLAVYEAKAPTCVEVGWDEYVVCKFPGCTYSTYDEKEKLWHDGEKDGTMLYLTSRLASCVEVGFCGRCNENYGEMDAHDEACKNPLSTKAACGVAAYCGVCQQYYGEVPQHQLQAVEAKKPTCLTVGYYAYVYCTVENCGYTTREEIAAIGHYEAVIEAVEPDCITTGWTEGAHCLNCYTILVAPQPVTALGHDGERAGQTTERDLIHTDSYLPDCKQGGYCGICGASYGYPNPTGEHDLITVPAQAATCQADGWDEYVMCRYCHYSTFEENVIPAIAHNPREYEAVAPTCTEPGYEQWTGCIYCMTRPTIPALGHDGERKGQTANSLIHEDSVYGDCETRNYCGICQTSYGDQPTGHVEGVPATCDTPATCKKCGKEYGKALGHHYNIYGQCINCGKRYDEE